jgi:dTMP kinase
MSKERNQYKGLFVMVDGIDGSGKSTIIQGIADWLKKNNLKIFDLKNYWIKHKNYPELYKVLKADVIVSAEPTLVWVGEAIRQELIHNKGVEKYSARLTAEAFSIDRAILYKKIIIPALKVGRIIIQDRGVTTSLVYQPAQSGKISIKKLLKLEGNALALHWAPDILLIADVKPEIAMERLKKRIAKQDNVIFEKLAFQKKIYRRFKSRWFKNLLKNYGSQVAYIDAAQPPQQMIKEAIEILKTYIYK